MKLSIITINYNDAKGLKKTLESVAAQTCQEFEHIIIDGGSFDGSVPIIKSYEEHIAANRFNNKTQYPQFAWVSEKDKGIYDAMNKGIAKASGEYLYFLNGGDCLTSENVVEDMIAQMDGTAIIVGRVNQVLEGKIVGCTKLLTESDLSMYQMCLHGINHQSALIRRDVQSHYLYDTVLYLSADWKFFMQAIVRDNVSVKIVDTVFADYDCGGVSANNQERIMEERKKALATIVSPRITDDYMAVLPHYYEVTRVQWLLQHPFWYKLYRRLTTFGRKLNEWANERVKE